MRLITVTATLENIFDNLIVEFSRFNKTSIHYLVGNNGTGKTHLLQLLNSCISAPVNNAGLNGLSGSLEFKSIVFHEGTHVEVQGSLKWSPGLHSNAPLSMDGGKDLIQLVEGNTRNNRGKLIPEEKARGYRSSALSDVEINFSKSEIKTITADVADSKDGIEVSKNLNTVIPQILINIKSQDDSKKSEWIDNNPGKIPPNPIPGLKLPRFIEAYNEIFSGNKEFLAIEPEAGEHKIKFKDGEGNVVEISDLSSGEKQVIFRLGFILKNLESMDNGTILIDEPEISLHPKWQFQFKKLLLRIFQGKNVQIVIATHSPYIFGKMDQSIEECILINRIENSATKLEFPNIYNSSDNPSIDAPSMSLVSFIAYGIPSTALHIELYNAIQIKINDDTVRGAEQFLVQQGIAKENRSIAGGDRFVEDDGSRGHPADETLPTWIRNSLNHPMRDRKSFDDDNLESSILLMLRALE